MTCPSTLDAQLAEQITVTAEAPVVDASEADLATAVTETQIDNLPILGRDFKDLVLLTPGAGNAFGGRVSVNGARGIQTDYNIDGAAPGLRLGCRRERPLGAARRRRPFHHPAAVDPLCRSDRGDRGPLQPDQPELHHHRPLPDVSEHPDARAARQRGAHRDQCDRIRISARQARSTRSVCRGSIRWRCGCGINAES